MASRRSWKIIPRRGQLEEARPLVDQLMTMGEEIMRLAGGLSMETLRQVVEAGDDANRTEGV